MPIRPVDFLLALSVPAIWGFGFVFAKAAIDGFPPILLMAFRFTLTALALVWFVRPHRHLMGRLALVALVSAAIQYSLTFNGLAGLDASTASLVVQLEVPFLVLLGAVFLGEHVGLRKWAGIAIAFAGVALIAGEPRLQGALVYVLLVVSGAFAWAIGQILIRRAGDIGGFTLIAWVAVFAAPQLFVMSAIFENDQIAYIRSADWVVWAAIVYLGLVMTALGYGIWYGLLGRYPVSHVGPFLLLLPVFSILGGVTILGDTLTWMTIAGGLLVVVGVASIVIERRPAGRTAEAGAHAEQALAAAAPPSPIAAALEPDRAGSAEAGEREPPTGAAVVAGDPAPSRFRD